MQCRVANVVTLSLAMLSCPLYLERNRRRYTLGVPAAGHGAQNSCVQAPAGSLTDNTCSLTGSLCCSMTFNLGDKVSA